MADCKACGAWFSSTTPQELCPTCERALKQLNGYVAPVVHGEWVNIQGGFWRVGTCSVCGEHYPTGGSNYCPNCGAKMDGGKDNVQKT